MDPMVFNVIWEDLMDESEENKDIIAKNKEQEVDKKNRKDENNKENSEAQGMVNIENVGIKPVENMTTNVIEMSLSDFQTMYGIDFNEFDSHEPSAIDQFSTSPVNKPSIPNVKDCFKQLTHEEVKQQICDAENRNTLKKTMVDVNKFKRFLSTKQEKMEIHEIDPDMLDEYLANYVLSVRKCDGSEYEPSTIRNMISSIDRKLKRNKYPVKLSKKTIQITFSLHGML